MKKYVKLLCSILVLAALCTSLVFVASAEEAEPFVKSFEATDYSGKSITGGTTTAKSSVAGNRVTAVNTMNASNSSFISIANAKYSSDDYIVAYANKDYSGTPSSSNNLAFSVDTAASDPFTVIGDGAKGYYVIDFDVATHGNMLPGFDVSVVMRRASDGAGFPFSDEIYVGNYITESDSWSHVTIVGDIKNNVAKVYVNGVFMGDSGLAVRNDQSNANQLASDTQVKTLGFRVELTRNNIQSTVSNGDNAAFDNFSHRLYIKDGAELQAAIESGDITSWSGYTSGRGGEKMPVVATVEGVEYRNFKELNKGFATNDTVKVEFLAQPFGPVEICVNANINTNGMDRAKLFTLHPDCKIKSTNGNIITTTAPFVSNLGESHVTPSSAASSIRASHADNLFAEFSANNYDRVNGRTMYAISDKYTGSFYINERVHSGTVDNNSNTYNDWFPSGKKIPYVVGSEQHIIIDLDIAMHTNDPYTLKMITRTSSAGSAWGNNDLSLNKVLEGYALDEFVHLTIVLSTDTKDATVFVNGEYVLTQNDIITDTSDHYFQCMRGGGNSSASVSYTNVCMREYKDGVITTAVNEQDISLWSGNVYDESYKMPTTPSLAIVDGVPYYDEAGLESALYGNKKTPAVVKILHVFEEEITVRCDSEIYTYGQDVKFVNENGAALTPNKNGVIIYDVPYIEVKVEKNVAISGTDPVQEIYNAIKSGVKGNMLNSFVPSLGNWGSEGYRNASLVTNIDTGDVIYRDSALLNLNGGVNGDSAEYADMKFTATTLQYEPGKNEYVVVDFDFGTDSTLTEDVLVELVPTSGASASGVALKELGILDGDMAHITVVFDLSANTAYVFVNGLIAYSVDGAAFDSNSAYLAGTDVTVDSFRVYTAQMTGSVCFDNVAIRAFDYDVTEDGLGDALASGVIADWNGSVYSVDYKISKLPTLAIVDGRDYGSLETLNKVLAIGTNYIKNVELKYVPSGAIKILSEATVETNGLDVNLDWNTGLYEFDPGIERYRGTKTGLAYASTKFIYTTVGTTYTFQTINAENCWSNASVAIWASRITASSEVTFNEYDVVFYPYGEVMKPFNDGTYLENGKLNTVTWREVIITGKNTFTQQAVSEYPVASPTETTRIYLSRITGSAANYAATDMLYSANISTDITFKFYVNKNQTVSETGEVATIDGKEYVVFTYELAPHEVGKIITVSFDILNNGVIYTQKQDICFVDYARVLLETPDVDKSLIVSLLNYANEAHALFDENGAKISSVTELVNEYSSYIVNEDLTEKLDTSDLREVIRSAAMRLNTTPEFVFRVARGFRGTITLSYSSLGETVEHTVNVNTLACEQNITLKGLNIYDAAADITITVTSYDSATAIVGQYNLATYAQSLEDNAFAVALYNYAKLALEYQSIVGEKYLTVN